MSVTNNNYPESNSNDIALINDLTAVFRKYGIKSALLITIKDGYLDSMLVRKELHSLESRILTDIAQTINASYTEDPSSNN
jgi:hypothetical protein